MQVTAEVAYLDEVGKRSRRRRAELTAVLAQLRLDVVHAQQRVDLGLGGATVSLSGGVVKHAVLGDMQPLAHGCVAQGHVVLPGAGEVLEQVPELVGGDDAQIDALLSKPMSADSAVKLALMNNRGMKAELIRLEAEIGDFARASGVLSN